MIWICIALLAASNLWLTKRAVQSRREIDGLIDICYGLLHGLHLAADTISQVHHEANKPEDLDGE